MDDQSRRRIGDRDEQLPRDDQSRGARNNRVATRLLRHSRPEIHADQLLIDNQISSGGGETFDVSLFSPFIVVIAIDRQHRAVCWRPVSALLQSGVTIVSVYNRIDWTDCRQR